ncbi:MAG: GntR family transcriptional regulator [Verrucomicrobiae bacterium]|nr:GntR family transcriptional regulator [Verrucomicrobiae bacterium]
MNLKPPLERRPLHQQIASLLREEIVSNCKEGQKLESESALAKRFSVSFLTIREALRTLAQDGLVVRRHGSGTYVADRSAQRHVAVLIDFDVSDPRTSYSYLAEIQQARHFFESRGFKAKLYVGRRQLGVDQKVDGLTCQEFLKEAQDGRLAGVMAVATPFDARWVDLLRSNRIPVVGDGEEYPVRVRWDCLKLVRDGVACLAKRNCRRVAVMGWKGWGGPLRNDGMTWIDVVKTALQEQGLPFYEGWIRSDTHPNLNGAGWEEFREIWRAGDEKPDGLLACDDILFADAAMAIMDLGIKVPSQLVVATHANKGAGTFYPFPVIRLEQDPEAYAVKMCEMLLALMKNEELSEKQVYLPFQRLIELDAQALTACAAGTQALGH